MRETFDLSQGWRFRHGDIARRNTSGVHTERYPAAEWMKAGNHGVATPGYPDEEWETVDLPHDFLLGLGFSEEADPTHGSIPTGVGWYRRGFGLDAADAGRRIRLVFDGVYRDSEVWLNGHFAGRHLSGWTGFSFDVTEACRFGGVNVVAVRADAREPEQWSYEGGGIHRGVRLEKLPACHVAPEGVWVRAERRGDGSAEVRVEAEVAHEAPGEAAEASVRFRVLGPAGGELATAEQPLTVAARSRATAATTLRLAAPALWSPDAPALHRLVTEVVIAGEVIDRVVTRFGVRSLRFDAAEGFFLNDEPLKIRGVCNHADHAGVGTAVPAALDRWRLERLLEMGANAVRTSHHPPSPQLLDLCDELGVLVLDEHRQVGASPEHLRQLTDLLRRDRNHPCVIGWCIGNEEMNVQHTATGVRQLARMQELCHQLDPTRPVTYAMNCGWGENAAIHDDAGFRLDVYGVNYACRSHGDVTAEMYDDFHAAFPDWPLLATEAGGSTAWRGVYDASDMPGGVPLEDSILWRNPDRAGVLSAHGETTTPWGSTVEEAWAAVDARPFLAGAFLWTGFDYRGETYPAGWPAVVTGYGLMDLCGFPKDAYHCHRVWWSGEPSIHLLPHWSWTGRKEEGEPIEVWCYANADAVELRLDGESLGRRAVPRLGHAAWSVPWRPGRLEAVGLDADGRVVATAAHVTAGPPAALRLTADRAHLAADGRDVVPVTVSCVDAGGVAVPDADARCAFRLDGPGRILGTGNGDPCSHEDDRAPARRLFHGLAQVLVQAGDAPGVLRLTATAPGLEPATLTLDARPASAPPRLPAVWERTVAAVAGAAGAVDNAL